MLGLGLVLTLGPDAVSAQQHQHDPAMHGQATHDPAASGHTPAEMGQSAFAALAEIIAMLEADPATDWSKVDIEGLRAHLVDMNEVTLYAEVVMRETAGGAEFTVTGPARAQAALHRMIPAHAGAMAGDPRTAWGFGPAADGGMRVTLTVKDPADEAGVQQIRALGFVGMLVRGMHHGPHHLAIARGENPHGGAHGHGHEHGHEHGHGHEF
jgi:hypothetical protein